MDSLESVMKTKAYYNDEERGRRRRAQLGGAGLEVSILAEADECGNLSNILTPNILKNISKDLQLDEEAESNYYIYGLYNILKISFYYYSTLSI